MESFVQADIFFFVTAIAVIICTIVFMIVGYYVIKTMKNIARISESLKNSVENTESELRDMSNHVRDSALFTFIFGRRKKSKKKSE